MLLDSSKRSVASQHTWSLTFQNHLLYHLLYSTLQDMSLFASSVMQMIYKFDKFADVFHASIAQKTWDTF